MALKMVKLVGENDETVLINPLHVSSIRPKQFRLPGEEGDLTEVSTIGCIDYVKGTPRLIAAVLGAVIDG